MTSIDSSQVTGEPFQKALGQAQPDIADMVGIARRGWFFIAAGIAFGLLGAFAVLHNLPLSTGRVLELRSNERNRGTCNRTRSPMSR